MAVFDDAADDDASFGNEKASTSQQFRVRQVSIIVDARIVSPIDSHYSHEKIVIFIMENYRIPDGAGIGHVHLKVADIDRALTFYKDVLGFDQVMRLGEDAAFLSAGGYHHHIAPQYLAEPARARRPRRITRASTTSPSAIRRGATLARAVRRVIDAGVPLQGVADHGVSESIYLSDLDGNGVELTRDRPESEWPRDAQGTITMLMADPLDLKALLQEAS